ncbi:MAG: type II toxin-antitoxin system VapC family toxin [Candidatus Brocadia sp.]|jgi:PIN domain.|uniref:PIN domain protein n=1 Tax=Candidatus Brocadia fulgida TaxID=380242 RepID=A0A0M2US66_9BACT|nr:MAG: PIN domain protein [Candidatus Brocadia fulgida]UJS20892.1 MAG: type II toxin-antitoxin system VapC family toxin [Candidatus Brocadia sp.]
MNLFFDTSALVKYFHEEEGTTIVTKLINSKENKIWVLDLFRLEFISALYRRFRNNEIDGTILNEAIEGFGEAFTYFNIEPLGEIIIREAEYLLKGYGKYHGLRTLDALHLGCFSLISEDDWLFVSADENLCKVAKYIVFERKPPRAL